MYSGWIGAQETDAGALQEMGVEIYSRWNQVVGTFDYVKMTAEVYEVFRKKWTGYRVWGVVAKREVVYTTEELHGAEDVPF